MRDDASGCAPMAVRNVDEFGIVEPDLITEMWMRESGIMTAMPVDGLFVFFV